MKEKLIELLGLNADATEGQVLSAVQQLKQTAPAPVADPVATPARIKRAARPARDPLASFRSREFSSL